MRKKIVCSTLAMALAASMLFGCASESKTETTAAAGETTAAAETTAEAAKAETNGENRGEIVHHVRLVANRRSESRGSLPTRSEWIHPRLRVYFAFQSLKSCGFSMMDGIFSNIFFRRSVSNLVVRS